MQRAQCLSKSSKGHIAVLACRSIASVIAIALVLSVATCSANNGSPPGSDAGPADDNSDSTFDIDIDQDPNAPCFATDPHADFDGDGYSIAQGDCNDCSRQVNPGAYDFPGNGVDEDCNGIVDDEPTGCDIGFDIEGLDPLDAARSLGLCRFTTEDAVGENRTWGVISAQYVFADGSTKSVYPDASGAACTGTGGEDAPPNALSHGILASFGTVVPRDGESMVVLSTGVAREGVNGDSPEKAKMCTKSATPSGFPTPSSAACPGVTIDDTAVANDPMALELRIRVPTNAKAFSFDFNFYTFEFPGFVCTPYNDFFVAILESDHLDTPANRNISFDNMGNPVSVNNGFMEVCKAGTYGGKSFPCPLGPAELTGTGFEDHGATGWLRTTASVVPGEEIVLRFAIWDMRDEVVDSTVLLDNIQWEIEEGQTGTDRPPIY
ncbi:MAG: putative metal-binding motif-containing protein [Polyangiaceae bacterium]|nr:putative metal-binding motif-containing protein [Polyangiaceae bacterium]